MADNSPNGSPGLSSVLRACQDWMLAWSGPVVGLGGVPGAPVRAGGLAGWAAGQARTQAPPERIRPRRARVRRLIAAHRVCSQASFLAVPM
jgi:hypothetical protein